MLVALLLLWLSPNASGVAADPEVDEDSGGAPYAAGELLVPPSSQEGTIGAVDFPTGPHDGVVNDETKRKSRCRVRNPARSA